MSARDHVPTMLVAGLSSAFGVGLLAATEVIVSLVAADDGIGSVGAVRTVVSITASVFIAIAVYVAAVVTTNTVATIVAGRTREIALARLLGATAASRRRALAREGLLAGGAGALIGAGVGVGVVVLGTGIAVRADVLPDIEFGFLSWTMALPILGVALTTWLAAWVGSRRVLDVSPMAALGAAVPASAESIARRTGRRVVSVLLFWSGTALLAAAVPIGLLSPYALFIGVLGGILSFTGVVLGAVFVIPPALRLVGRVAGRGTAGRLGAANAVRYPERSSRAAIGLVIGVALVTMFVVAAETARRILLVQAEASWGTTEPIDETLNALMTIFGFLVGYSAVIAAVGLVNTLTVGVLQRTREFGLLRALGFTREQVRATVMSEAAQLTVTAIALGLVLGIGYGWVGAIALLGQEGVQPPVVPWWLLVGVAVVAAVLTAAASVVPANRAARLAPVAALAVQ